MRHIFNGLIVEFAAQQELARPWRLLRVMYEILSTYVTVKYLVPSMGWNVTQFPASGIPMVLGKIAEVSLLQRVDSHSQKSSENGTEFDAGVCF